MFVLFLVCVCCVVLVCLVSCLIVVSRNCGCECLVGRYECVVGVFVLLLMCVLVCELVCLVSCLIVRVPRVWL